MSKVLFIGGTGRTGSTLIDRVLGSCPNWLSGGELAFLWSYGLRDGGLCSCEEPIVSCPLWSTALAAATADGPIDHLRMIELRQRFWSMHLPLLLVPGLGRRRLAALEEFPDNVARLYRAALDTTGSRVLVDSSKDTHYSWILRERTNLDIYYLHLVRDPRAIGHSWRRRRPERGFRDREDMERRGVLKTSAYFTVSDIAAEALWQRHPDHYRMLRYEDFVVDPVGVCAQIANFVGEPLDLTGVLSGHTFEPRARHTTWGNPNRFEQHTTTIRADEAWRTEQPRWRSTLLALLNAPVARRYGYRIMPDAPLAPLPRSTGRA